MQRTRTTFVVSTIISAVLLWTYAGFYPAAAGILPATQGTLLNTLMRIVIFPIVIVVIIGGGLALLNVLEAITHREIDATTLRRTYAWFVPPSVLWIGFTISWIIPNTPTAVGVGTAIVVASGLYLIRETLDAGVFRH